MKAEVYAHYDTQCHFTIVPSRLVTDKVEVELRACVMGKGNAEKPVSIEFYWDEYDSGKRIAQSGVKTLAPEGTVYFSAFAKTAGMSGRHQLMAAFSAGGMPIAAKYIPLQIVPCETRALPFIQWVWIEPGWYGKSLSSGEVTPEDIYEEMKRYQALGIRGAILVATEFIFNGGGAFFPSKMPEFAQKPNLHFDLVEALLSACDKLQMDVFVGLGRGDDLWLLWTGLMDQARIDKQLDFTRRLAQELWENYGHHDSFYGWYIAHETDTIQNAAVYYDPVADHLHSLCPDKPVMISPSPGCVIPDEDCQKAREIIKSAHYDVVAYQDSVGAGTHPFGNTWNAERRIANLHKYYRRNLKSHEGTGKHMWANMEIWRMPGPSYSSGSYAAAWSQVARQLEIQRIYADHISVYAVPGLFQDREARVQYPNAMKPEAPYALYEEYKAYYQQAKDVYGL